MKIIYEKRICKRGDLYSIAMMLCSMLSNFLLLSPFESMRYFAPVGVIVFFILFTRSFTTKHYYYNINDKKLKVIEDQTEYPYLYYVVEADNISEPVYCQGTVYIPKNIESVKI